MPKVFKTLANIMIWVLWLSALFMGLLTFVMGVIRGDIFSTTSVPIIMYLGAYIVVLLFAISAVVAMLLRKKME